VRAAEFLARPEGTIAALRALGVKPEVREEWAEAVEIRLRYRGYIEQQQRLADRAAELDAVVLPASLWSRQLSGVSHEASEKLRRWQPGTVGQAGRIAGVSPSDLAILLVHARRERGAPKIGDVAEDPPIGL
jgi:tRNA uridine 5-carboxymethylaminomethyl modification enzyme